MLLGFGLLILLDELRHLALPLRGVQLIGYLIENVVKMINRVYDLFCVLFLQPNNPRIFRIEEFDAFSVPIVVHVDTVDVIRSIENVSIL